MKKPLTLILKQYLEGAGSVLEILPPSTDYIDLQEIYPHESEEDALRGDFEKIGLDFGEAIAAFETQRLIDLKKIGQDCRQDIDAFDKQKHGAA